MLCVAMLLLSGGIEARAQGNSVSSSTTPQTQPIEHPLMPAIRLAAQSVKRLEQVQDYEATFIKRELIGGQLTTQKMQMRVRERPFSVYLKFLDPSPGREIVYVSGQNNNQMLVHEATGVKSFAGTIPLDLSSPLAMAENRHPISEIGISNLLKLVLEQWDIESKFQESNVRYFPNAKLGEIECEVIENSHPVPRKQFKYHITRLFIEKQSRLPIRVENWGFPQQQGQQPPLVEEYTYTNIRVNVGLKEVHFDVRNPEYGFNAK